MLGDGQPDEEDGFKHHVLGIDARRLILIEPFVVRTADLSPELDPDLDVRETSASDFSSGRTLSRAFSAFRSNPSAACFYAAWPHPASRVGHFGPVLCLSDDDLGEVIHRVHESHRRERLGRESNELEVIRPAPPSTCSRRWVTRFSADSRWTSTAGFVAMTAQSISGAGSVLRPCI